MRPPSSPGNSAPQPPTSLLRERNFLLVCASHVLGYLGTGLLGPVLPLFLVSQGRGESFAGLVLGTYNVVSFMARPFMGALVDRGGPRLAMRWASLGMTLAPLGYLLPFTPTLFLTRGIHGLGWASFNVGGSTWVGILAPAAKRAEALGYYTLAQRIGSGIAPVVGLWLADALGYPWVFAASACVGLMIAISVHSTTKRPTPTHAVDLGPWQRRIFERSALFAALLQTLASISAVPMMTFMPLYFRHLGLGHVELYFAGIGVAGIVSRALVGPLADRLGRKRAVAIGLLLQLAALLITAGADTELLLGIAGLLYTFGWAWSEPSLYAMGMDGAPADRRGVAMATFTASFQAGTGVGSVLSGLVAEHLGYTTLYGWIWLFGALALVLVLISRRRGTLTADSRS